MDTNLSAIEKDSGHLYRVSEIPNWQFTFYVVLTYIVRSPDGEELKNYYKHMEIINNLQRFVVAQEGGNRWNDPSYEQALLEVRNGSKISHWIWYIFPQMTRRIHSERSLYYRIKDRDEAKAYIEHPILGPRLIEISQAYLDTGKEAYLVFGNDAEKVHNCMLLFASVSDNPVFKEVCKQNCWII